MDAEMLRAQIGHRTGRIQDAAQVLLAEFGDLCHFMLGFAAEEPAARSVADAMVREVMVTCEELGASIDSLGTRTHLQALLQELPPPPGAPPEKSERDD